MHLSFSKTYATRVVLLLMGGSSTFFVLHIYFTRGEKTVIFLVKKCRCCLPNICCIVLQLLDYDCTHRGMYMSTRDIMSGHAISYILVFLFPLVGKYR